MIKMISAAFSFQKDLLEVKIDCHEWLRVLLKADELRVSGISFGLTQEYGSGQQTFTPYGDQSFNVQI